MPSKSPQPAAKPAAKKPAPVKDKAAAGAAHPLEGTPAPDFKLVGQDGKSVSLKELTARGNVVLYFYPKDSTPGCTTEACSFRDNIGGLRELGAEVIGVSADSSASHDKFIAKYELNFPLLSDPDNKTSKAYGVYKKKSLYGREFIGIERTTFIIDRKGVIRKVFPKVKVNGHTEEVVAALKELD
ncbi:MAG: thioredoxin-dependent thiol peroxidase [Candidatus Binataceae bacterium]|jgi:peroxiredoxin Q/BCP